MTIAPIKKSVSVKAPPEQAFELFATRITEWWPAGRSPGENPHVAIVIEPFVDGRWFERDAEGRETQWGKVLDWSPPSRLLLGWQLAWRPGAKFAFDPTLVTEVELTFEPDDTGGTTLTLEHRNLERLGADAAAGAERVSGGWSVRLEDFRDYADGNQPTNRDSTGEMPCGQ